MDWKGGLAFSLALLAAGPGSAQVQIDVDLGAQIMRVSASAGENYEWPISSGSIGNATPRGDFRPYALYPMIYSWKYGNEPMPHSIFFHGQYAIHGTLETDLLGRPASHGCIRLSPRAAATLYQLVSREGAVIHIGGGPEFASPSPPLRLIPLPMGRALELEPADSPAGR
jgi:lipoprotein-anchoring transpeptidase ErfK/SrfK